jgi:hypothetical protein
MHRLMITHDDQRPVILARCRVHRRTMTVSIWGIRSPLLTRTIN